MDIREFQKEVLETEERIDAFLLAVQSTPDPALLSLRGKALLTYTEELLSEASAFAKALSSHQKSIAEQLRQVLLMEKKSLEKVLSVLTEQNAAQQAGEEISRLLSLKQTKEKLWKEIEEK